MTPNRTETLPNRQSCDRCHKQKLRCTRQGSGEADSCIRCLRQGVRCVYSATLPKGRPSAHRQATNSSAPLAPVPAPVPTTLPPPTSDPSPSHPLAPSVPFLPLPMAAGAEDAAGDMWILDGLEPWPSSDEGVADAPDNTNSADDIAQLSELSVRLYPLYRLTCSLSSTNSPGEPVSPLINNTVFESLAAFLVSGNNPTQHTTPMGALPSPASTCGNPNSTNTLHDTLAASRHLLEILRRLQVSEGPMRANTGFWAPFNNQPATSHPRSMSMSTSISIESLLPDLGTGGMASNHAHHPPPLTASSGAVVRHLVLACHTLLLETYCALFVALQHDADLLRDRSYFPASDFDTDAGVLTDMRLALVVQLSSYFIHRLRQAVGPYLSARIPPLQDRPYQLNMSASPTDSLGPICDLEIQVQQRLARLRQTLYI
ncbi:hypothetical protein F5Y04DRAFT_267013 [Hypomontagnella monticulosa]|nr:hypothetical protein F5Y04DRAFT_267013 [Hypomontagnella monticulosa]